MTEIEKMERAKMYLDKLANGIHPLTDCPVPENDTINNVRISRCLFYVSDILRQVIENGGTIGKTIRAKRADKVPFHISQEDAKRYSISPKPIPVSEITRRINDLIDPDTMTKLKYTSITTFLMDSGFLAPAETKDGTTTRMPTAQGQAIGISVEEREGTNGHYRVTVYNTAAQQFLLDNIEAIIETNRLASTPKPKSAEYQGKPWEPGHDEALIDLYKKNVPISEIAITLKRTETAVHSRLKKHGLIIE